MGWNVSFFSSFAWFGQILECEIKSYLMLALTLKIDLKLMRSFREFFFCLFKVFSHFFVVAFTKRPHHLPIETEWKMLVDFLEAWNTYPIHLKVWVNRIHFLTERCIKYVSFLTLNVCVCLHSAVYTNSLVYVLIYLSYTPFSARRLPVISYYQAIFM